MGNKKDRYDDLPEMSLKELEDEINFFTFIDKVVDVQIPPKLKMMNKMWLDSVWIEVKRRGYVWEYSVRLMNKNSETDKKKKKVVA